MSNSFQLYESQHTRPPCPSPTPGIHPNPCPLSWWCHPTISSSVILFPSRLQSLPASESFQMSQFFASGDQSIGVSTSNISPSNEYSGLISFKSEKEVLIDKDVLIEIPWTEEPSGLQSMELQRVRHNWAHTHNTQYIHLYTNAVIKDNFKRNGSLGRSEPRKVLMLSWLY